MMAYWQVPLQMGSCEKSLRQVQVTLLLLLQSMCSGVLVISGYCQWDKLFDVGTLLVQRHVHFKVVVCVDLLLGCL